MEAETPTRPDMQTQNSTQKTIGITHHALFGALSFLIVIIGMGAVYMWQHSKVDTLNNNLDNYQTALIKDAKISLDNLNALRALPNVVVDTASSPTDLIAFLGADNTQCYKHGGSGFYKVIAQTNDQFAQMQYGCTAKGGTAPLGSSPAYILAKKDSGKWALISPTNQWLTINGQDLPSCTMVNDNKISKLVTSQCWQSQASSSANFSADKADIVQVTNP